MNARQISASIQKPSVDLRGFIRERDLIEECDSLR